MISIVKPYIPPKEVLMPALEKTIYSGYIAQGEKVEDFEFKLGQYFENINLLTVNSGTSALHLSLILANVGPGDEVISTALTAEPTNTAIAQTGAKVIWADTELFTGLICPKSVKKLITNKTKAIMIVHYAGMVANLNEFYSIRDNYNISIIEDCAHAFGSTYKGSKIGNHGNICTFSFQAIKHLTTGDGGCAIFPNENQVKRAKLLRWYGIDRENNRKDFRCESDISEYGFKFHMNDINATIGINNLPGVKENIAKTIDNANFYNQELVNVPGVTLLENNSDRQSSYWIYTLKVERQQDFMSKMQECNIMVSRVHERNDIHSCMSEFRTDLPNLDKLVKEMICIPVGWWVTPEDRQYIVECIKEGW